MNNKPNNKFTKKNINLSIMDANGIKEKSQELRYFLQEHKINIIAQIRTRAER